MKAKHIFTGHSSGEKARTLDKNIGPFGNLRRGGPGAPGDGNLRLGSAPADPPAYSGLPRLEQAADGGEGAPGHSRMQNVMPRFVQFAMLVELTSCMNC